MAEEESKAAKESLSQFLARVLDQLSITAWLPALVLVAVTLMLSQLARADGSLPDAFNAIGRMGAAAIVFLVAAVVVAAMFTQAFEFEAIRVIEGYWPRTGMIGRLTRRRCQRKVDQLNRLRDEQSAVARRALESARADLRVKQHLGSGAFDALESYVANVPMLDVTTDIERRQARRVVSRWKEYADPSLVRELEGVESLVAEFPSRRHRVLPTRLGNVVRSVEDRAAVDDGARRAADRPAEDSKSRRRGTGRAAAVLVQWGRPRLHRRARRTGSPELVLAVIRSQQSSHQSCTLAEPSNVRIDLLRVNDKLWLIVNR